MRVIASKEEMRRACREAARPLGLVPTMGALHQGHLSLVDRARADCASVAVSIFVNPTQFAEGEDFAEYPRDLELDLEMLRQRGVDLVFVPDVAEVYPPGFHTWVDVGPIADRLEGAARPGHFRGVATVVAKLFGVVQPERAYFGQKDGQQTVVVRKLARDLDMGIEVVVLPTVREADGLAMSSRNVRLNPEQRQAAAVVYRALSAGLGIWYGGETDATAIVSTAQLQLDSEPLVRSVDYVSLADPETLEELALASPGGMLSVAAHLGSVRLIDNVILE
ncbi:MAG: pantoate--beta-alanine ligase [Chloroflexi bacterium]|nr:pantoate--beta-alanine ligase [Chloroflexota bacterium]MYE41484.1 pantoate--beta-alanine ligase [Chloroflexota bacterium]